MTEKPLLDNDRFLGGEKFFYRGKSLFAVCGEYRRRGRVVRYVRDPRRFL